MRGDSGEGRIPNAPAGLAILALVGPSFVWCAEYIGSGEVILATRTGALLGPAILWAIVLAILLKYVIGLSGARWTAITGEGMVDLFARIPGPRNWLVWLVLGVQFLAGIVSIGALANAATTFFNALFPLPFAHGHLVWMAVVLVTGAGVAWSGRFSVLKAAMSGLVAVIVIGAFYVAFRTLPPLRDLASGFLGLSPIEIPGWAFEKLEAFNQLPTTDKALSLTSWGELIPLTGWAAGGFASQVWYSYWVLGAGYGMAAGRSFGVPADTERLARLTPEEGGRIRGWCRMVTADASVALLIGVVVTTGFALAGAGALRQALEGASPEVFGEMLIKPTSALAKMVPSQWGVVGRKIFLAAGCAAMISTQIGQLSGWPRLLADCVRIVHPPFAKRFTWKQQFRGFLLFFVVTNAVLILAFNPVVLIKLGGTLDGMLLTPIQALAILVAFLVVLPKLVPREVWKMVRPGPLILGGLVVSGIFFGVLCVLYLPGTLKALFSS
ncbi:MAG: Nramp family divalent metal transporter [Planctomycetes bacterium]|nr:Nramp family divalent metal transporter [Planctomycetota bacterium]